MINNKLILPCPWMFSIWLAYIIKFIHTIVTCNIINSANAWRRKFQLNRYPEWRWRFTMMMVCHHDSARHPQHQAILKMIAPGIHSGGYIRAVHSAALNSAIMIRRSCTFISEELIFKMNINRTHATVNLQWHVGPLTVRRRSLYCIRVNYANE